MSKYVHKSHNVSVLIYHFVCPAKYRKVIFSKEVDDTLKGICLEISITTKASRLPSFSSSPEKCISYRVHELMSWFLQADKAWTSIAYR